MRVERRQHVRFAALALACAAACRAAAPEVAAPVQGEDRARDLAAPHTDEDLQWIVEHALASFQVDASSVYVTRDEDHAGWRRCLERGGADFLTKNSTLFEIVVRGDFEVYRVEPRPRGPNTVVCSPSFLIIVDRNNSRLILRINE
jgi:hypothetical protein